MDTDVGGSTFLEIDVCSWRQSVYDALKDKIVDDAEEMGAFMEYGLFIYFFDSTDYAGYDHVVISNATSVAFRIATPSPTGNGDVDGDGGSESTLIAFPSDTTAQPMEDALFYEQYTEYLLHGIVALSLLCCSVFALILFWCNNQRRIKRELAETRQQCQDLQSLASTEGNISGISPSSTSKQERDAVTTHRPQAGYEQFHAAHSPVSQPLAASPKSLAMSSMPLSSVQHQTPQSFGEMQMAMSYEHQQQQHHMTVPGPPSHDDHDDDEEDDDGLYEAGNYKTPGIQETQDTADEDEEYEYEHEYDEEEH